MRTTRGRRDPAGDPPADLRLSPPCGAGELIAGPVDQGICGSHGPGTAVAARPAGRRGDLPGVPCGAAPAEVIRRAAARAGHGGPARMRAETFGRHLGTLIRPYLPAPREERFPEAIERIKTSLGGGSPVSRR